MSWRYSNDYSWPLEYAILEREK